MASGCLQSPELAPMASDPNAAMAEANAATGRSLRIAIAAAPLLLVFGWLMAERLIRCPQGNQADFAQEWTSARNFWTGRPIYQPLAESFPQYFGAGARTKLLVNAHPPVAVVAVLPWGLLDYRAAWTTWNLLSLALLAGSLWLLMRPAGLNYLPLDAVPLAALLLASNPLAQQVIEGQMNLLLLALVVGAWAADRGERPLLAGALVGLAAAVKLYPALLAVYFLGRGGWKALVACGLSFAGASAVAMGLLGVDIFAIYARDVLPGFAPFGDNLANASLGGLWSKVFVGIPGQSAPVVFLPVAARLASLVSGLAIAALCCYQSWRASDQRERDLAFTACMIGMLLASPITWGHSFALLVMPLLIIWRHNAERPLVRGSLVAIFCLVWLVRPAWIWNAAIPGLEALAAGLAPADYLIEPVYTLTALSYLTYALLALLGLAVVPHPHPLADVHRS